MVHVLAVALSLDAGAASHFARLALRCARQGISEQARSRDEWRTRGAVAARTPSGVLRLLRLALDRARPLDARAPLAAVPAAPRGGGDPRAARRAPRSGGRRRGGGVLRPAEPQELRADLRLGVAPEARGRAARLGFARGATLGGGAATARRHRHPRFPRLPAAADLSHPHRRASEHRLRALAGAGLRAGRPRRQTRRARRRARADLLREGHGGAAQVGARWRGLPLALAGGGGADGARPLPARVSRLGEGVPAGGETDAGDRVRPHGPEDRPPRWPQSVARALSVRALRGSAAARAGAPRRHARPGIAAVHRQRELRRRALARNVRRADARRARAGRTAQPLTTPGPFSEMPSARASRARERFPRPGGTRA